MLKFGPLYLEGFMSADYKAFFFAFDSSYSNKIGNIWRKTIENMKICFNIFRYMDERALCCQTADQRKKLGIFDKSACFVTEN
jgi:hypothetical protein